MEKSRVYYMDQIDWDLRDLCGGKLYLNIKDLLEEDSHVKEPDGGIVKLKVIKNRFLQRI